MKFIENADSFRKMGVKVPVNFLLLKKIHLTEFGLPVNFYNKFYKCNFQRHCIYYKPLDII